MTDIPLHSRHRIPHLIIVPYVVRGQDIHSLLVLAEGLGVRRVGRHLFLGATRTDAGTESDDDVVEEVLSEDE